MRVERSRHNQKQNKTHFSKGASGEPSVVGEAVITPIAVVRDDPTVLDSILHLPGGVHGQLPGVLGECNLLVQTTARIFPLNQSLND